MSLISIRLPEDVETRLAGEAERVRRPKSEIAREAIVDYLERMERERFLSEIARAARSRGDEEVLAAAEEALSLDNEALAIVEGAGVREPSARYRKRKTKKKTKKKTKRKKR
jgi:predicted DNA-binding protein